ncbi:trypsin-like peptidase domain-containing protein [bacterium]|nr:trypsin-like peptidase domain-containing protein [bacterium]
MRLLGENRSLAIFLLALCFTLVVMRSPLFASPSSYLPEERQTIEVYKRTKDAVVFISTESMSGDVLSSGGNSSIKGAGAGFVIDEEKRIVVTSLHVISDAKAMKILLSDGKTYPARLLGHDPEYDVAILQLLDGPEKLVSIPFGNSRKLEVGQRVLAIGNPHGLARTLTSGIISSLHRTVRSPHNTVMSDLIQTDAALNPGSSGGPLLNSRGELIGMNVAILSQSGDSAGISFAIPIHRIRRVLPELVATGKVLRPRVGWLLVNTNQGPLVRRVRDGGPADEAGVQPLEREVGTPFQGGFRQDFQQADLIRRIQGKVVHTEEDVDRLVLSARRGEPITVELQRGGKGGPVRTVVLKPVLE